MEEQKEIQRQFWQKQEKYVYYIIALSVAAIGFSVYKTSGQALNWIQIPLGLSVSCWGMSIFFGLRFLKYLVSTLYTNNAYFDIIQGRNSVVGTHPENIKIAINEIKKIMKTNSERASNLGSWQERFFYAGIVLFIVWHVLEMCQLTR